jgi:hypothetical protein
MDLDTYKQLGYSYLGSRHAGRDPEPDRRG